MATQPPMMMRQDDLTRTSQAKMAVAQSVKPKSASKAASSTNSTTKSKSQLHRRSRTGCYTCRLRRKKCDEVLNQCSACKHLGLTCDYKRPAWWSNNDIRKQHKDNIKTIIKSKKLSTKPSQTIQTTVTTPPGLSHSLPTSATLSEPFDRGRSGSIDSHFSSAFDFNSPPTEYAPFSHPSPHLHRGFAINSYYPYEIDVKTERQMFVDDVPTIKESTISTFSTLQTPPPPGTILPSSQWSEHHVLEERTESLSEETLNPHFFDFSHGPPMTSRQVAIELDENDQKLFDHFVSQVLPTIFPILDTNQHGSVGSDLVLPALQTNKSYLHCCLAISAQHLKATMGGAQSADDVDQDIMRHRYATISSLCDALNRDENHQEILEATLGLIFFQSVVGRLDDGLPDIPWHQHFQAAISLVQKLDLPRLVSSAESPLHQTPFNMTLTAWIDIVGASMQGCAPMFAHTYREKHLSNSPSLGLRELMGCDDKVMYLISEISCLEALKRDGMEEVIICQHVLALAEQIGLTELDEAPPRDPFNENGTLSPRQLSRNMTTAFRIAARIYLCSLVLGFNPSQPSCVRLVEQLASTLQHIPPGPSGFDRSLVWVYLVGGSVSLPGSNFRAVFEDRMAQLSDLGAFGSVGRTATLLREVWAQSDAQVAARAGPASPIFDEGDKVWYVPAPYVHWRDVMQIKNWDFLLM